VCFFLGGRDKGYKVFFFFFFLWLVNLVNINRCILIDVTVENLQQQPIFDPSTSKLI